MKYRIEVAPDAFGDSTILADAVREATGREHPRLLLVADANVVQRTEGLGPRIGRYLQTNGLELAGRSVVLSGGEKIKADALQSPQRVAEAAVAAGLGAEDCLLALGGGTVLDVASFAAAQLRVRPRLVRVPTTPAALFDAAFAETGALNAAGRKDALTLPAAPDVVVLDPAFAQTVLDGVWCAGFAEVVRLAAVSDAELFAAFAARVDAIRRRSAEALAELVERTVCVRRRVGGTPFALSTAACLEELSGFKLPHGYAVSIAVCAEVAYAALRGLVSESEATSVRRALSACGALEGLAHSAYLLERGEALAGVRSAAEVLPSPFGTAGREDSFDGALYLQALNLIKYTP